MGAQPLTPPLDGELLRRDLTALAQGVRDPAALRTQALNRLKEALAETRAAARRALDAGSPGIAVARMLCQGQDVLIQALYDFARKHIYYAQVPSAAERLSVVAVGGYGRGALAPGSDIDLLFLLPAKQTAWGESVVEFILYMLWDLGLKVGHATRSIAECLRLAKSDFTIRTAVLEARYLTGDEPLFADLKHRFRSEIVTQGSAQAFIAAKLEERDGRHRAAGASRYLVEPNVKDGKGGLRDLHTLFWIAKYLHRVEDAGDLVGAGLFTPEEMERFRDAESFLWRVRCHLHFLTGRAEERLTFDLQPELARRFGHTQEPRHHAVEEFMKAYFLVAKDVGDLTRVFCAGLEAGHQKPVPFFGRWFSPGRKKLTDAVFVETGRVDVTGPDVFDKDPVNLLRIFALADEHGLDVHPRALTHVRRKLHLIDNGLRAHPQANALFLKMLASRRDPERPLRLMNEAGVFGAFIPDFGRIVAMMQFNMYHHYTVDEHLIRVVGNVARIERGELQEEHPLATKVIHQIRMREGLYLAALLHDIAKGRPEDHSEEGEAIARALGPRLGLPAAEVETVAWLVRQHLLMSDVAQRRDLADPKTIADFAREVQSLERLRLLLILTVADIRGVGPGVWNGWKGQLLRQLYYEAESVLSGGHAGAGRASRVAAAKVALAERLRGWPAAARERMLNRHYDAYWLALPVESHERHAALTRHADESEAPLTVTFAADPFRAVTEVTVFTADHPGLFARLAGALAAAGGSIVDAKIFTTVDGMALDVFWVQNAEGKAVEETQRLERLRTAIEETLAGRLRPADALRAAKRKKREEPFEVAPRVTVDNDASDTATVIEVTGRDRPGLLHDLTYALFKLGLSIHSAQVATYGERAIDVFYVKDAFGLKIVAPARLQAIEQALLAALSAAAPDKAA